MEGDFLVLGADEVVDDVGAGGRSAAVAEPALAEEALDDARRIVDTAVAVDSSEGEVILSLERSWVGARRATDLHACGGSSLLRSSSMPSKSSS